MTGLVPEEIRRVGDMPVALPICHREVKGAESIAGAASIAALSKPAMARLCYRRIASAI
jgi:hypothetical protein